MLGKEELQELFPKSKIKEISLPDKQRTVTCCYTITNPLIYAGYPDKEKVKAALYSLKDRTRNKIRNRETNGLGERGKSRKYAFYCQQYVNVEEAIEIMEEQNIVVTDFDFIESLLQEYDNMTLADIIQSGFSQREKQKMIEELAEKDTEEGVKARKYLGMPKEK